MKTARRAAAALLLLAASPALAQQSQSGSGSSAQASSGPQGPSGPGGATRRAPRTPPPEAVAACSGKSAGASCTFQHRDRTETGSCFTPDASMPVACKPVRPPREDGDVGGTTR